ncbi:MAG: hypothetical protein ACREBH_00725 [Candidatus Micrarchaeaceae archaeon]
MRAAYVLSCMAMMAMLSLCINAQYSTVNSSTGIGVAINSTKQFISTVNQSSYLVFYPNLTESYMYLHMAVNESKSNPGYAYILLGEAKASAQHQKQKLASYKTVSLYVLAAFTLVFAASIYVLMRPYRPKTGRKSSKN